MTILDSIVALMFDNERCIICQKSLNKHEVSDILRCFNKGNNQ